MADVAPPASESGSSPRAASERSAAAGPRLIAALALSSMLAPLNSTMLSVVLGPIGRDLRVPTADLTQLLVTSYLITGIVLQAPSGKLGDRLGHRRALSIGQAVIVLGSILGFVAPSGGILALARVLMAAGSALVVPSATALLRLELPPERRGQAFGAFGASMALAAAIGPIAGGFLEWAFSWRATFLANLAVIPIAALLARAPAGSPLAPSRSLRGMRIDGIGALLLGGALAAVVIGVGASGATRAIALAVALALALAFVPWERRHPEPILDLALLRRPVLVAGAGLTALHNFAMYALLFELPRALERGLGLGGHESGPLLGAMMIVMVVAAPIAGRLSDRMGARSLALAGSAVGAGGIALLVLVPLTSPVAMLPGLIALGFGLGITSAPSQAAAMTAAPRESSGMAAAMLSTMRYLGGVAGILALGIVQSVSVGESPSVEHHRALLLFGAALVASLACAAALPREPARRAPPP